MFDHRAPNLSRGLKLEGQRTGSACRHVTGGKALTTRGQTVYCPKETRWRHIAGFAQYVRQRLAEQEGGGIEPDRAPVIPSGEFTDSARG